MLIACDACHRQYDVGTHEPGARVRCFCGEVLTVPESRPRDARMLHCSSCGAGLPEGTTQCGFCNSAVGLGEKGLGDACPNCFSRMVADAKFCSSCGTEIRPVAVLRALSDRFCPRCRSALSECSTGDTSFVECTSCGGLWLGEDTFRNLTRRREKGAVPVVLANRPTPQSGGRDAKADFQKVVYLSCPVCEQKMHRQNFARSSGVIVDWCKGHGFWFDADELERILEFVDQGGLDRQRDREKNELESARRRAESARRDHAPAHVTFGTPRVQSGSFDVLEALTSLVGRWLW